MAKDVYYFPHDANAHDDPKCSALIADYGMEGYGLYWMIIETLHEQCEGKLEKFPKLYDGLAFKLKVDKELLTKLIEALLHDYNLLKEDERFIWSDRVLRNLEERRDKRLLKAEAGRLGGIKSGEVRRESKQNEAERSDASTNEAKESKVKESKVKESKVEESKVEVVEENETKPEWLLLLLELKEFNYEQQWIDDIEWKYSDRDLELVAMEFKEKWRHQPDKVHVTQMFINSLDYARSKGRFKKKR